MSQLWTPRAYQKEGVKQVVANGAKGLFLIPGQGKTSIMLAAFSILKKKGFVKRALVIAPKKVATLVWPDEVAKWSNFAHLKMVVLHGKDKDALAREFADLYVINPEGLDWLIGSGAFKKLKCDMLVIDESTRFRHPKSQRFKLLKSVLGTFSRRYILTGTPIPNEYEDLWGQVFILDGGNALGRYITHYRNRYFFPSGWGGYEFRLQQGGAEAIQEAIAPLIFHVPESEVDLPELVVTDVPVQLPPAALKVYREMEREMMTMLEKPTTTVIATTAATASLKCHQVANGGLYLHAMTEEGILRKGTDRWRDLHDEKDSAVADLVDELHGRPALVLYGFEHDRQRLLKRFPSVPTLAGGTSTKEARRIVDGWNAGTIPVLLAHPAAMGHGLNLQESGGAVVWYSLPWDLDHYDQTTARIRRPGNPDPRTYVYHIVAKGTVDEAILIALKRKDKTQKALLEGLRTWVRRL